MMSKCSSLGIFSSLFSSSLEVNSHQIYYRWLSNLQPHISSLNLLYISKLYSRISWQHFYFPFTFISANGIHLLNLKPDNPDSSLFIKFHIKIISRSCWVCLQIHNSSLLISYLDGCMLLLSISYDSPLLPYAQFISSIIAHMILKCTLIWLTRPRVIYLIYR